LTDAANPRVPAPKSRVVSLSPTFAGRDVARATAEIELSLKLSKKLTADDSVPDTVAACQEWLNEEMGARAEDARLLMSNGQKFMDTPVCVAKSFCDLRHCPFGRFDREKSVSCLCQAIRDRQLMPNRLLCPKC
jgi:hypothetical protein